MANFQFILRTALRDSRRDRGRLFLFMSSIILGIAALVAITSFNDNLQRDIDKEAASLLGADLSLRSNQTIRDESKVIFDSLPGETASEVELLSMAYLPRRGESQFVRIKGLSGGFPFYGTLTTIPEEASQQFRGTSKALVEQGMMLEKDLQIGDSIKLGEYTFEIGGELKSLFGGTGISGNFAPVIYVDQQYIDSTGLIQPGSVVNYFYYKKLPESFDVERWSETREDMLRNDGVRLETVADRQENVSEAFDQLSSFLNLVALVSLLLGCIGVASSVFIYIKKKVASIAILRCLGMKGHQAFLVYLVQILILGILSVLIGAAIGSLIQTALPFLLSDFLPFEVEMRVSIGAILEGVAIGTILTLLFAAIPLLSIRRITPLQVLRVNATSTQQVWKDPLLWGVSILIALFLFLFLSKLTASWGDGFGFTIGLIVGFAVLFLFARIVMWFIKKFFPRKFDFVLRQGLANLFRPNNQTQILLVSIGLGTAVLATLFIVRSLILANFASMDAGNQPNMFLYSIETDQLDTVSAMAEADGMEIIQRLPIVTMRLAGWQGRTRDEWLADTSRTTRSWPIHREGRVTYRDYLDENEEVTEGTFTPSRKSPSDSIFISLAEPYADALDLSVGDEVVYNVQGAMVKTYISSIREIDNANMRARFLILFPTGVLEGAPQFHVLVTKSPSAETMSAFRTKVVRKYPNISVIDLGMVLETVGEIVRKVSYIIQFMAIFSILTGLIVLISSLYLSKYQRIRESVLLRTIGASRNQILKINATEYALLGALSAATGIGLSMVASYLMATFQMDLDFFVEPLPLLITFLIVTGLTLLVGLLNTREVISKPPLEVLRKEID